MRQGKPRNPDQGSEYRNLAEAMGVLSVVEAFLISTLILRSYLGLSSTVVLQISLRTVRVVRCRLNAQIGVDECEYGKRQPHIVPALIDGE